MRRFKNLVIVSLVAHALVSSLGSPMRRAEAISPSATTGFTVIACCSGTPTGVPAYTNADTVNAVYDTNGKKMYVYASGWNQVH